MAQAKRKTENRKPITAPQIKRIHVIIHALRIDDDTYRTALAERFNVTTCKDLSMSQAQAFIKDLEKIAIKMELDYQHTEPKQAEKQPERFSELDNRPGMATPPQLRKIEAMWEEVSRIDEPEARKIALRHFIRRVAKVAHIRFLDMKAATATINALTAMQKTAKAAKSKNAA